VSGSMFDETWQHVIRMATVSGKTKVLSLLLAWSYYHKLYEPQSELSRNATATRSPSGRTTLQCIFSSIT
jgi:hypothetical protein